MIANTWGCCMEAKPIDVKQAMWTRKAILDYLNGQANLNWVLGEIESAGDWEAAQHFLRELGRYGDPQRREDLCRRLNAEAA